MARRPFLFLLLLGTAVFTRAAEPVAVFGDALARSPGFAAELGHAGFDPVPLDAAGLARAGEQEARLLIIAPDAPCPPESRREISRFLANRGNVIVVGGAAFDYSPQPVRSVPAVDLAHPAKFEILQPDAKGPSVRFYSEPARVSTIALGMNAATIWREKPMAFALGAIELAEEASGRFASTSALASLRVPFRANETAVPSWLFNPFHGTRHVPTAPLSLVAADSGEASGPLPTVWLCPPPEVPHPGVQMGTDTKREFSTTAAREQRRLPLWRLRDPPPGDDGVVAELRLLAAGHHEGAGLALFGVAPADLVRDPALRASLIRTAQTLLREPRIAAVTINTTAQAAADSAAPLLLVRARNPLGPSWVLSDILGVQIVLANIDPNPDWRHIANRNLRAYLDGGYSASGYFQAEALAWAWLDTADAALRRRIAEHLTATFVPDLLGGRVDDMFERGARMTLRALPMIYYRRYVADEPGVRAALLKHVWTFGSETSERSMRRLAEAHPKPHHGESIAASKYASFSALWAVELLDPGASLLRRP